jgi:hypothetical protein
MIPWAQWPLWVKLGLVATVAGVLIVLVVIAQGAVTFYVEDVPHGTGNASLHRGPELMLAPWAGTLIVAGVLGAAVYVGHRIQTAAARGGGRRK